jgi:hypothetical protein
MMSIQGVYMKEKVRRVTPLHLAVKAGNNSSVNIILRYMAKIKNNCSETFKDILPQLVDHNSFSVYIQNLPFSTISMENKQTLKVPSKFSHNIVSINEANTSYIDEDFFKTTVREEVNNPNFPNFPVEVEALKINWILRD